MHGVSAQNDRQKFGPATCRSTARSGPRKLVAPLAVSLVAALGFTSAAFADTGDPVSTGSFKLKPSRAFKNQLRRNGAVMRPKAFSLKTGSINPVTGEGELSLNGRLHFKHGKQKVTYAQVAATLGASGYLTGYLLRRNGELDRRASKLFKLRGGTANRNGFGAEISGIKATLLSSAATKLNRKLGLHSLHAGKAGAVSVSEQPQTVEVTGGTSHVVPDSDTGGIGNVAGKLAAHCIGFIAGNTAIAPGIKNDPDINNPSYDFPVTGGTISPTGTDGVVQQAGGIQVKNNQPSEPSNPCHNSTPAAVQQTDFANYLLGNYISAHVVVSIPPPPPLGGDHGIAIASNLDPANATVSADPVNRTLTIRGVVATINGATALILNQAFPQPGTYDPSQDFVSGDLFGTVDLTVTTR
jgi:hypothetical protein